MKRSCQIQITGFDRPERRMISFVPQPSAVIENTEGPTTLMNGPYIPISLGNGHYTAERVM